MTTEVLQDIRTELETLCRVQLPYLSFIRSPNDDIDTPNTEEASWSHYGYDRRSASLSASSSDDLLRRHVFASIWERSLDPRRLGEDDDSPEISTIAWRKWPPDIPRLPGGVKIPVENVYLIESNFPPEAFPVESSTNEFYHNLKGILNTSQTKSISCNPPALLFLNSDKGMFYSVKVKLKNIGNVPRRVKIVPPSNTSFEAYWHDQNTTVVPGLTVTLHVNFKPNSSESINELLFITVEGDGGLTIPLVSAAVPPPILLIEEWNCGCCVLYSRRHEQFEIKNVGSTGRFWLLTEDEFKFEYIAYQKDFQKSLAVIKAQAEAHQRHLYERNHAEDGMHLPSKKKKAKKHVRSPFKFHPVCFKLERNQKIKIKVKYLPKTAGFHYEKVAVMCDNGEVRWIALKGIGMDIKSRRLVELQAFPYWSGPPADLPTDTVNCQYSIDLGDLTGGETGSRNYKMVNKSCIPLYFFWAVRPLSVDERSLSTHQAFQQFYEESLQACEWADYTNMWDDGDPVDDDRVEVKIHPSQGVLKPKQNVNFELSAVCPHQPGYFCCVVSLFAEQVDEESMTVINPFLKSLEELQINDVPIHLDDLLATMPQDANVHEKSEKPEKNKKNRKKAKDDSEALRQQKVSIKIPDVRFHEWEGEAHELLQPPPTPVPEPPRPDPLLMEFLHPDKALKHSSSSDDNVRLGDGSDVLTHKDSDIALPDDDDALYVVTHGDAGHDRIERMEIPLSKRHRHHKKSNNRSYQGGQSIALDARVSKQTGKNASMESRMSERGTLNRLYSAAQSIPEDGQRYSSGYKTDFSLTSAEGQVRTGGGDADGMIEYDEYRGEYEYEMDEEEEGEDILEELEPEPPHSGFRKLPKTYTWLDEHAALRPIAEIEVWLRSVPLQIEFQPPFIIATGFVKTRVQKNLVVYNKSLFDVEVALNQMVDPSATILVEPAALNLKPNQRLTFKISVLYERHGKCFQPITGTMRIGKLKTEAPCSIACSIETVGPYIKTDTPVINFEVIKVSTEKMKTISITNVHNRTAKWIAGINQEGLIDETNTNLSPFNATVCEQKLLRVWPTWGVLEPQETMGVNIYLSGELTGQIAASVTVMVEGIPDSALYIPICAEVQSPFLVLEDCVVLISRDLLYIQKHVDNPVTLTNPTGYPVPFAWQSCLVGRQSELVSIQFDPPAGILPPKGTQDCTFTVFYKTDFERHIRNAYAMCFVDGMKEPLVLRVSTY